MSGTNEHGSEVAHLLLRISAEYEAARQGLQGLARGSCQHRFITRRMERMSELHTQLQALVGDEAIALISACLDQAGEDTAH
ncbi:MAG TPA: hypothetical protein VGF67_04180 [Ktedonobacteraceae bacterium]|jgi:hypothetical protein